MRQCFASLIFVFLSTTQTWACETDVCLVDPSSLRLPHIITFDETQSSRGPGYIIKDVLVMPGAVFGERFAGQSVTSRGDHDQITGAALPPLTIVPGAPGQNLSVVFFDGNNVLNGYGAAGFPKRRAQGEGAIAFLFDEDQSALAFQLRGGEAGTAEVSFLMRDGRVLTRLALPPAGEHAFGFIRRNGVSDIAGVLIVNDDPQGLAIDNLKFGKSPDLSDGPPADAGGIIWWNVIPGTA